MPVRQLADVAFPVAFRIIKNVNTKVEYQSPRGQLVASQKDPWNSIKKLTVQNIVYAVFEAVFVANQNKQVFNFSIGTRLNLVFQGI